MGLKYYEGKDGREHDIYDGDLKWIKEHADLLDNNVRFFGAVAQASRNDSVRSMHDVFDFVRNNADDPVLDEVYNNVAGEGEDYNDVYYVDTKELRKYLSTYVMETDLAYDYISVSDFIEKFIIDWSGWVNKSGKHFNKPYDGLIIAYRTSEASITSILVYYFLEIHNNAYAQMAFQRPTKDSPEEVAKYVLKYADDPNFLK